MPKQKLVIAEKPSVGMALAKVLGCLGKRDGYMIIASPHYCPAAIDSEILCTISSSIGCSIPG